MVRKTALIAPLALSLVVVTGASAALAQKGDEDKDTLDRAGHIATQPVRDVGLSKDKIPPVLQRAVENVYAVPRRCRELVTDLTDLNAALGRDFDWPPAKGDDKATLIAQAGGEFVVNSLSPFRGLVREVTGAAAADRRRLAALNAGLARRGFLRGLAQERRCKLPPPPPADVVKDEDKDKGRDKN